MIFKSIAVICMLSIGGAKDYDFCFKNAEPFWTTKFFNTKQECMEFNQTIVGILDLDFKKRGVHASFFCKEVVKT